MLQVIETTEHYVRHQGIHRQTAGEMAATLPTPSSSRARRLRQRLLDFVQQQASQVAEAERLLGCSEVPELIIGKFKHLAGERGHYGLTGMVLSIGALVGRTTAAAAQAVLTEVSNHDVWDRCHSHLGPTLQSLRHRMRLALAPEQKQKPLLLRAS